MVRSAKTKVLLMKTLKTAALLVSALAVFSAPAVFAMDQELSMLELSAKNVLEQNNVEGVDVMSLTLTQLAQIKAIVDSDRDTTTKKSQIEKVVGQ